MSGPFTGMVGAFKRRSGDVGFLDRLDDVRGRLIASLIALVITTIAGFYLVLNFDVLGFFTAPMAPYLAGNKLKFLSPMDPFFVSMKLAIALGLVLALPYILAQVWGVTAPLMRPEERRLLGLPLGEKFGRQLPFCVRTAAPGSGTGAGRIDDDAIELADEIVEGAGVPKRGTLAWYRLACGLPRTLPLSKLAGTPAEDRKKAASDYAVVLGALGDCTRTRTPPKG